MTAAQQQKHERLTGAPIPGLIARLAIPSIISMLVTSIYNMADSMFLGRISTQATAAVGVVFSYMALVQAMGFFFGQGSANYISRALGARNEAGAKKMAAAGFFSAFFAGAALSATGILFMEPVLRFFGATPSVMEDAKGYFFFIAFATPFMASSLVLNNQMRLQGNAKLGMAGIATGAVLNIVLDPLFIFAFNMGTAGASLATFVSQAAGFCILLAMTRREDTVEVRLRNFRPSAEAYREIAKCGMPSLGRQGFQSVAAIVLNNCAAFYGDAAIAAFAVVNRVTMLGSSLVIGIGQGFQPVCGFNYGAARYGRVREAFRFTLCVTSIVAVLYAACVYLFAPQLVFAFRPGDVEVAAIGADALRAQAILMPALGVITMVSMILQNIGKTASATFLAVARHGCFFIPAAILGTAFLGLGGTEIAQPLADAATCAVSIPLGRRILAELREKEGASEGASRILPHGCSTEAA